MSVSTNEKAVLVQLSTYPSQTLVVFNQRENSFGPKKKKRPIKGLGGGDIKHTISSLLFLEKKCCP